MYSVFVLSWFKFKKYFQNNRTPEIRIIGDMGLCGIKFDTSFGSFSFYILNRIFYILKEQLSKLEVNTFVYGFV